ncbi:Transposon Ty3-G Gag-Pol polyprotein [Vitis vinifera]|uniref:Transposon Ty3-G Gag-Pol polyprotein n=1 Tax=Vitis vinifera TaxID=29760 RepID=A0A438J3I8_VITVI|nr:Transposon Ty3-G Gag-Pol polyprotein [Vitis vinifera]
MLDGWIFCSNLTSSSSITLENKVVDALSRRPHLLVVSSVNTMEFDSLKQHYSTDADFGVIWRQLLENTAAAKNKFSVKDAFLFHDNRLCIPCGSFKEFVISELHGGGLDGHFGVDKTFSMVSDRFFWPRLRCDVHKVVAHSSWDFVLPQAEFAFNNFINRSTGCTPFEVVFGFRPHTPLNLHSLTLPARPGEAALDFSSYMKNIHEEVKRRLSLSTEAYSTAANTRRKDRQFQVGDMVLIRLKPERFPPGSFNKLHARRARPFKVVKKLGPNAYVIELPADYGISHIFNIEDLTQFHGPEEPVPATSDLTTQQDAVIRVPKNTAPRDEIASILDHQFVTTRCGGYYKFLVKWKNRPQSDSV